MSLDGKGSTECLLLLLLLITLTHWPAQDNGQPYAPSVSGWEFFFSIFIFCLGDGIDSTERGE